jgi:hypothetical protein
MLRPKHPSPVFPVEGRETPACGVAVQVLLQIYKTQRHDGFEKNVQLGSIFFIYLLSAFVASW